MPTYRRDDGKPIVQFDAGLELSPFSLLRRLRSQQPTLLVDGRKASTDRRTLVGALPYPGDDWRPDDEQQTVVIFDNDGTEALNMVRCLRELGYVQVRLLFGGLDLYEFSLDPEITGAETFLQYL
jgi:hypothetical protein